MSQNNISKSTKSLVVATVFLILICHLAAAAHNFNNPFRNSKLISKELKNQTLERLKLIEYLRNLHKNSVHYNKKKYHAKNEIPYEKYEDSKTFFEVEPHFNTSCGKIVCEEVKDYPEESIRNALLAKFKSQHRRKKISTENSITKTVAMSGIFPMYEEAPFETLDDTVFRSNMLPQEHVYIHRRPNCRDQVKEVHPREAIDNKENPVIVVNISNLLNQSARECKAATYCKDALTPENYVFHCKSLKVWKKILIYNNSDIQNRTVQWADGCDCKFVREEHL